MARVVEKGTYIRIVPDTWEAHTDFHDYMRMYCGFTKEQSIEYAKKHLGPAPARVPVTMTEIIPDDDDTE